ncbi:MAG: hypothetical protein Q4F27_01960 [Desulfovibrionaceae bacterium]|nr:hypothetical protein [Desulfovibrionaceae bacterium]
MDGTGNAIRVADLRLGRDTRFDAWLYSMMMDNNLAFRMNPDIIASPEQLAFMVFLDEDQAYLPCSDSTFSLLRSGDTKHLQPLYNRAWRIIMRLVRSTVSDSVERRRVLQFCRYRFSQYIAQGTLIPSRLVKRMTDLVLAQNAQPGDPWQMRRALANEVQQKMLHLPEIRQNLEAMPSCPLPADMPSARKALNLHELARFICLSASGKDWQQDLPDAHEIRREMQAAAEACKPLFEYFSVEGNRRYTILFLCDADGGFVFDMAMLHSLIRMGHRVICAVKAGFYFFSPTMDDLQDDPVLEPWLRDACVLHDGQISKNDLLQHLREHRLVLISDGTRERLNLYRVSVTFSRAWKEADLIIGKGWRQADILLGTSHQFTRDVICYWKDSAGLHITLRKHAAKARKFSEGDIAAQSDAIIREMRLARTQGRSVMFYSCIIGSIPGQTAQAISLARTFVDNLRKKMDNVLIINPAEHFVEGMDGDDLMYMWERVQRSGFIDVWRFQTFEDIEESFALLGLKVPPAWSGKDATYSTGCTKEMRIALDVQARYREMQIIGPDPRLFSRRGEYGVGKYFDATISRPDGC